MANAICHLTSVLPVLPAVLKVRLPVAANAVDVAMTAAIVESAVVIAVDVVAIDY